MTSVLSVQGVIKRFGKREALGGIDLEVERGELLGLAGPNGSGKTTLLKILAGLSRPTRGTARLLGFDPFRDRVELMRRARFAFAPPALYDALTAREHLRHVGGLGGTAPRAQEIDDALELVQLRGRDREPVRTFSFGMRQRLMLALALVPTPEVLVLDEPADGLDPLAVLELRDILAQLNEERGVTIVLASHLLLELDKLVDRLFVLDEGSVLFCGTPDELRGTESGLRLRTSNGPAAAEALQRAEIAVDSQMDGELEVRGPLELERARAVLNAAEIELLEFARPRKTLEAALLERLAERRGERRRT